MVNSLYDRLLRRELDHHRHSNVRSIYGDKTWAYGLDIVNELGGHSGCVNALSWSKSGRLLASGSDDTNLVIHSYQPDGQTKPFSIATSISTGHTANIFSVKFMPHSNDNILVSCAGDSQVRVFDIEYSNRSHTASSNTVPGALGSATSNRYRYLTEGDTNAKVFKSHSDRVKRIVTESSPHLFLTCSEDGEVRQWDLRQPSSAYPEPRGGTGWLASQRDADDRVPPPLISYRRFRLDLNTISCSASQPHYIALGGAHLHCFLHDRRMLGRDLSSERGSPDSDVSINSDLHGDAMGQATQCVRRFAPNGQRKMSRSSNGHITACKISDANPNELIASWSGDHIYSFDILKSPDAGEPTAKTKSFSGKERLSSGESQDRKRKRKQASTPEGSASKQHRSQSPASGQHESENVALRVRYENGQSEDIALQTSASSAAMESTRRPVLTLSQRRSLSIAKSVVKIRRLVFSLDRPASGEHDTTDEMTNYASVFAETLNLSQSCLNGMNHVMRVWRYPMDDVPGDVAAHKAMRKQRDRARRFVQAAGTLSLLISRSAHQPTPLQMENFDEVKTLPMEGPFEEHSEIFRYDFVKAILAWLQGGSERLIEVFRTDPNAGRRSYRFPIPPNGSANSINRYLIRHLLLLAGQQPIVDLDVSKFEHNERRRLFPNEREAVTAFGHAVEMAEAAEKDTATSSSVDEEVRPVPSHSHRSPAVRNFWALKVARGVLLNVTGGLDFTLVDEAFGGLGIPRNVDYGRDQTEIDTEENDPEVQSAEIVGTVEGAFRAGDSEGANSSSVSEASTDEDLEEVEAMITMRRLRDEIIGQGSSDGEEDDEEDEDMLDAELDEDHEEDDDEDDDGEGATGSEADTVTVRNWRRNRLLWRSTSNRARLRETVDAHMPVNSHTRKYQGHCNVKTVKDVNFYGLNDEYVVSGSDSGHVFIWDRKTTQLLNILEGDGDVVNVAQGHPHEPMLAVSGIDHTIKIFSADRRAQREARLGINLSATQSQAESNFSSLGGSILRRVRATQPPRSDAETESLEPLLDGRGDSGRRRPGSDLPGTRRKIVRGTAAEATEGIWADERDTSDEDDDFASGQAGPTHRRGLSSSRRMHDSYEIVAHNDVERQGGLRDAYITRLWLTRTVVHGEQRGMLRQLALHLRARHFEGDGDDGDEDGDGEGRTIELDDNCAVM